jgi:hypothetical protein
MLFTFTPVIIPFFQSVSPEKVQNIILQNGVLRLMNVEDGMRQGQSVRELISTKRRED